MKSLLETIAEIFWTTDADMVLVTQGDWTQLKRELRQPNDQLQLGTVDHSEGDLGVPKILIAGKPVVRADVKKLTPVKTMITKLR